MVSTKQITIELKSDLKSISDWVWRQTLLIHLENRETRIASSLSPIEIFVALYYGGVLNYYPKNPLSDARDRMIISKGHGSICMYPILANLGFFSKEELKNIGKSGGILGGIPDPIIPGYETINGSLGHGLGVACGIAKGLKGKDQTKQAVFVLCGDGELHEGACWEAIMFAHHHQLDNVNLIIDDNSISMLDFTDKIVSHIDLPQKFKSFGWSVSEVDGHDVEDVRTALNKMKDKRENLPKVLIAKTLKGRGVPGLENKPLCHIINPKTETLKEILGINNE